MDNRAGHKKKNAHNKHHKGGAKKNFHGKQKVISVKGQKKWGQEMTVTLPPKAADFFRKLMLDQKQHKFKGKGRGKFHGNRRHHGGKGHNQSWRKHANKGKGKMQNQKPDKFNKPKLTKEEKAAIREEKKQAKEAKRAQKQAKKQQETVDQVDVEVADLQQEETAVEQTGENNAPSQEAVLEMLRGAFAGSDPANLPEWVVEALKETADEDPAQENEVMNIEEDVSEPDSKAARKEAKKAEKERKKAEKALKKQEKAAEKEARKLAKEQAKNKKEEEEHNNDLKALEEEDNKYDDLLQEMTPDERTELFKALHTMLTQEENGFGN